MIKQGSRNYAKRQLTWFRRDPRVMFIDKDICLKRKLLNKSILKNKKYKYYNK